MFKPSSLLKNNKIALKLKLFQLKILLKKILMTITTLNKIKPKIPKFKLILNKKNSYRQKKKSKFFKNK
jgi:hypothetical protein